MKKLFVFILAALLIVMSVSTAFSAYAAATGDEASAAAYSIVSVAVNRDYDFKDDFYDSYPYDEDFETVGIFELDDYNADVTLTLKNNSTGEEFVFEKNAQTEWTVKASVDHLLYETTQISATFHIYDLGGEYGIKDTDVPVTITVISSQYSADFHKYPSDNGSNASMVEGENFTVDYDASSGDHTAKIKVIKFPPVIYIDLFNVETRQRETYYYGEADMVFETEAEVTDYDPSKNHFWFLLPGKLTLADGYVYEFNLTVDAYHHRNALPDDATPDSPSSDPASDGTNTDTADNSASPDSANNSSTSDNASKGSGAAVRTGTAAGAAVLLGVLLIASGALLITEALRRKRRNTL